MSELPPPSPREKFAQIEADAFCSQCGYNLHGQKVWRDERLGFLICQCPECGRFHPAANASTASSVLLSRIATGLLVLWIVSIVVAAIILEIIFGGFQSAGERSWSNLQDVIWIVLWSGIFGSVAGAFAGAVFWHIRKWKLLLVSVLPFLPAVFLAADASASINSWYQRSPDAIWCLAGLQAFFILLGLLLAKPIARALVSVIVPPRPRQFFRFLWLIDGKEPPDRDSPGKT